MNQGFLKLRRGLKDHVKQGKLSNSELLIFIWLLMEADHTSGITWKTSAPYLALQLDYSLKIAKNALKRLELKGYIKRFRVQGKIGGYPILMNKYYVENKGSVVCDKTLSLSNIAYIPEPEEVPDKDPGGDRDRDRDRDPIIKKKEVIKKKKEKISPKKFDEDSLCFKAAKYLKGKIAQKHPQAIIPGSQIQSWAKDVDLMVRVDKRTLRELKDLINWVFDSDFWSQNIQSMGTLREKWQEGKIPKEMTQAEKDLAWRKKMGMA